MLMRYSATTFNGHRIHYDAPYARDVEGYAGLVVHGPMQATLMLNLAAETLGRLPRSFRYRGLAPLLCGAPFRVEMIAPSSRQLTTRVVSADGVATMSATIEPD
jgi:3-methylfumaryl-CoA hydratase